MTLPIVRTELQDGARIEQRACTGASRQNWTLEDMGSGRFRAKVLSSGKCLEPVEDTVINGTGLEQRTCDGTSKQLWTRQSTATVEGTYRFVHVDGNRCLDVPQQSTAEGVFINLWACHADMRPHQSWAIAQRAIAKHSDKCLDVRGGPQATEDGRVIDQWQCNEGAWNQFWTLRDAGNNQIRLVAQNSGKCIEPVNGGIENLTPLHQMTCSATAPAQLWTLQSTATLGEYKLVHGLSNKCIDIKQSLTTDGADALLFTCKTVNEANQTWKIGTPVAAPPTIETPIISGEYWGLPTRYPAKSPCGGLHQIFGSAFRWAPTTDMVYLGSYWRDVNPRENEYDWARLEERRNGSLYGLNEIVEAGKTAIIWISAFDFDKDRLHETTGLKGVWHAPDWVRTKCGSHAAEMIVNGEKWGLPLWNDCPRQELVKFITAMFSRYRTNENVKYGYVTTLNAGEFFIPMDEHYDVAVANGLTPQKLEIYARAVIDAWMTALGPAKVVWTRANDNWRLPGSESRLRRRAV